jgi:hypothetical protein
LSLSKPSAVYLTELNFPVTRQLKKKKKKRKKERNKITVSPENPSMVNVCGT